MPASVEILNVPIGSVLTSSIGANDEADKNDFTVLLIFSENVANLTESGITLSAGATLVSLEGENSVWKAVVRPPQTAGTVTVTVAANAVAEGNAQTSKDIEVVTSYPDTDAETPTLLFNHSNLPMQADSPCHRLGLLQVEGVIPLETWRFSHTPAFIRQLKGSRRVQQVLPSELSISMTRF